MGQFIDTFEYSDIRAQWRARLEGNGRDRADRIFSQSRGQSFPIGNQWEFEFQILSLEKIYHDWHASWSHLTQDLLFDPEIQSPER